jgi:molecular chaperone GrpE
MRHRTRRPVNGEHTADPATGKTQDAGEAGSTRAEERIAELDASPAAMGQQIDELHAQLDQSEREADELRTTLQRTAADFANYRRRTEQDRLATLGLANEALLSKLLAIVDDFDRAIANMPAELTGQGWAEGIVAIDRKLRQLLESEGLTPIEAEGRPFDPHQHEAVVREETAAVAEGTVTAELQRGYRIRDRVLRPAMVAVATSPSIEDNEHTAGNGEAGGSN